MFDRNTRYAILSQTFPGFVFMFLLMAPVSGFTQDHTYSIIKGTTQIGTLSATCQKINNRSLYTVRSEAKTRFIIDIHVYVTIDEIFDSGQMYHSLLIRKINGKEKVNNAVEKTGERYILKKKNNADKTSGAAIYYSAATMYFIEPRNIDHVYSENYQQLVPVIAVGANRYLIKFPNGNESYYTYSNGICTEVEAHTDWAVIFFKLNEAYTVNAMTKNK